MSQAGPGPAERIPNPEIGWDCIRNPGFVDRVLGFVDRPLSRTASGAMAAPGSGPPNNPPEDDFGPVVSTRATAFVPRATTSDYTANLAPSSSIYNSSPVCIEPT